MVKKKELGIAVASFGVLAVIMLVIMGFSILIFEILDTLHFPASSVIMYVLLGGSIGISAGFGYVIAQRLFDALLDKKTI